MIDDLTQAATASPWQLARPLFVGDTFFDRLEVLSRSATTAIDVDFYIFQDDVIGRRIFNALTEAARRGVAVRIIVDGVGSVWWSWAYAEKARQAGIQFRVYHQLWLDQLLTGAPQIQQRIRGMFSRFQLLNRRNHRKIAIFDRTTALVGSRNIASVHSESVFGQRAWRDSSIELEGHGVQILSTHFDYVWDSHRLIRRFARKRILSSKLRSLNGTIRHNLTRTARRRNFNRLVADIEQAQHRVWITNAYFVPHNRFLEAIASAARRGCDVQIIVPAISDVFFIPWVASALQKGLLDAGARIYEYLPRVLHAKTMIIDDRVLLGSSNLNHRSVLFDLETDIVVFDPETTAQFRCQFEVDRQSSREITVTEWASQKLWWRVAGTLLLPLRRWM